MKFVLGDPQGKLASLITEKIGQEKKVIGIRTCDGQRHAADLVIVAGNGPCLLIVLPLFLTSCAAGGWTASIMPEARQTVETTAGTLMFIDIPKHRQDLWTKFHPDNYPVWSYRRGHGDR